MYLPTQTVVYFDFPTLFLCLGVILREDMPTGHVKTNNLWSVVIFHVTYVNCKNLYKSRHAKLGNPSRSVGIHFFELITCKYYNVVFSFVIIEHK